MSEHRAESPGTVKERGHFDSDDTRDVTANVIAQKIEKHGEVHAQFDSLDGEVELRLGTTRVNYDADVFEVWDGDHYRTFPVSELSYAYRPMGVFHGGN